MFSLLRASKKFQVFKREVEDEGEGDGGDNPDKDKEFVEKDHDVSSSSSDESGEPEEEIESTTVDDSSLGDVLPGSSSALIIVSPVAICCLGIFSGLKRIKNLVRFNKSSTSLSSLTDQPHPYLDHFEESLVCLLSQNITLHCTWTSFD